VPSKFERARTQLRYGERLRRARRRTEAREQLKPALAAFEELAAAAWAERARGELQAAGLTTRPRRDSAATDALTPQELRSALILADGATVREAAAQLFLSPKTVEAHFGRAYRKLGVRNRAELATKVAERRTIPA
jgi:DNA-binding CsgD family transcriptional regulator